MNKKYLAVMICAIVGGGTYYALNNSQSPEVAKTTPDHPADKMATNDSDQEMHNTTDTQSRTNTALVDDIDIQILPTAEPRYFYTAQIPHENGQGTVFETPPDARIKITSENDAKRLITEGGAEHFNLSDDDDVTIVSSKRDQMGNAYYKYQQTYKGIPVDGRDLIVAADQENYSSMVAGFFESNINIDTNPELEGNQALEQAYDIDNMITHEKPELEIHVAYGEPQLVYRSVIQYNSNETGLHLDEVFINANDGNVVSTVNRIHTGLNRNINTKNGGCIKSPDELPGTFLFGESGPSSNADKYAKDAYKNMGIAYHFYKQMFKRDSLDNKGLQLKATVKIKLDMGQGCQGDNAFFMGPPQNQMVFAADGDKLVNPAGALDITGHELTHGVISQESELKYENESGAINEALADIFGSGTEAWFHSGGSEKGNPAQIKTTKNNWTLGETAAQDDDMKRLMYDPTGDGRSKDSYKDRGVCNSATGGYNTYGGGGSGGPYPGPGGPGGPYPGPSGPGGPYPGPGGPGGPGGGQGGGNSCPDNGYVHTNSGIMNLAFYMLSEGGTHPRNKTNNKVNGIGMEKALKIYYHASINTFTSTTGFKIARTLLAKSAETLYGKCSAEWTAVNESYDAVQVPGTWTKCSGGGNTGGGNTGGGNTGGGNTGGGNTGSKGCATESLTNKLNTASQLQQNFRAFRDEELATSDNGKRIEALYYQHSDEIKDLIKSDWILRLSGLRLLVRANYALSQNENTVIPLNKGYTKLAINFLDRAAQKGSSALKADVDELKSIISQFNGLTTKALKENINTL